MGSAESSEVLISFGGKPGFDPVEISSDSCSIFTLKASHPDLCLSFVLIGYTWCYTPL